MLADLKVQTVGHALGNRRHPDEWAGALEIHIARLEEAVATAEALDKRRQQEAEVGAKRIEALEANIIKLKEAVAKAESLGEQRRREAKTASKRANDLVAELVDMTSELVQMTKRLAEQTAEMDKLRAEFDDYRSRSWWWQHTSGDMLTCDADSR
jgi:chromosome segregation ATPase